MIRARTPLATQSTDVATHGVDHATHSVALATHGVAPAPSVADRQRDWRRAQPEVVA